MTPPITEEQLAELERLEREALPGPWMVYTSRDVDVRRELAELVDGTLGATADLHYVTGPLDLAPAVTGCGELSEHHAAFIVAARNALPQLIAEVRRLKEENAAPLRHGAAQERARIVSWLLKFRYGWARHFSAEELARDIERGEAGE